MSVKDFNQAGESYESQEPTACIPRKQGAHVTTLTCDEAQPHTFSSYSTESVTENVLWLQSLGVVVPSSAHLPLQGII